MSYTQETTFSGTTFSKYTKRAGTENYTSEYDYLMMTFIALKLVNNKEIEDFQITNSDINYDYFDDLVVKIRFLNGKSSNFAFQTRYLLHKRTLHLGREWNNIGPVPFVRMLESLQKINTREEVNCIFYTNTSINFKTEQSVPLSSEKEITVKPSERNDCYDIFNTGKVFQLIPEDIKERDFQQLYFYCNQMSIKDLKTNLGGMLSHLLQHQLLYNFLNLMKEWFSSPFILTKKDLVLQLAELAFSPFIRTLSNEIDNNEKCQVLKTVIMNFDITFVEDFNIIENMWLLPEQYSTDIKLNPKQLFFLRQSHDPEDIKTIKRLWYSNNIPLVLKLDDWNKTIINKGIRLLNEHNLMKKLVLVGPSHEEFRYYQNTFRNFIDLKNKNIDLDLFADFHIFLQARKYSISLADLFVSDPEVPAAFTVDDLLQMTQNNITVGEKVIDVPTEYITRIIKTSVGPPVKEEDIFTVFNTNVNLISSEPGCGKSTLMASLANNCPPCYWSVYVKLREHHMLFKKKPHAEEILRQFLKIEPNSDTLLERVKMAFFRSGNIYLFLDGLDEVDCVDIVLDFVESVKKHVHVWMSSRTNLTQHISNRFQINPISIEKFQKDQVLEYFNKLPIKNQDLPREIVSITPLEMSLLSYALLNKKLIQVATIPNIFQAFFESQVDGTMLEKYKILALKFCLKSKLFAKLNLEKGVFEKALRDIQHNDDNFQIIAKIDEDGAVFENRSYAEYFASVWLADNKSQVKLLDEFLFAEENENLKKMLDMILARESVLHVAVIDQDGKKVKENEKNLLTKDSGGRTALHVLCSYQNVDKDLLEIVLEGNSPFEKDKLFSWSPLEYAIKTKNLLAIDKFLEKENDSSEFDDVFQIKEIGVLATELGYSHLLSSAIKRNPNIINSEQSSLLHIAVTSKHDNVFKIVDILTQNGIDLNAKDKKNRTPLQLVLESGDCGLSRYLIEQGANLNVKSNQERNFLHHAVSTKKSNLQIIDLLVEKGIDVNAKDLDGATPLHIACGQGNFENFNALIKKGVDVDVRTLYGKNVLHYASATEEPNLQIINHLIKVIDINSPDSEGVTVLHLAAKNGHKELIELFLDLSVDINANDNNGITALHLASERGDYDLVQYLLNHGASFICSNNGRTALHYAISSIEPNTDLISFLLYRKIDIDGEDCDGKTPLQLASELGHYEVVEILLEAEAKSRKTRIGRNALHYTTSPEVAQLLIEKLENVDSQADEDGVTALHLACQRRQFDLVKMLSGRTNVLRAVSKSGRNALHFAASTCATNTEIIQFLLKGGVPLEGDHEGITPLHVACRFNNNYNVEILLEQGADVNALTENKENALHFAAVNIFPNEMMLNLLLAKGVHLTQLNLDGKSPIQLASELGYEKIVNFLRNYKQK